MITNDVLHKTIFIISKMMAESLMKAESPYLKNKVKMLLIKMCLSNNEKESILSSAFIRIIDISIDRQPSLYSYTLPASVTFDDFKSMIKADFHTFFENDLEGKSFDEYMTHFKRIFDYGGVWKGPNCIFFDVDIATCSELINL